MSPLEYIIEKTVEANPSIKELRFGALLEFDRGGNGTYLWHKNTKEVFYRLHGNAHTYQKTKYCSIEKLKIIGRPVRLADILLAVGDEGILKVNNVGGFSQLVRGNETAEWVDLAYPRWNLQKEDITLQSPETQLFIARLLGYQEK